MKKENEKHTIRCPCCNEIVEISMSDAGEITSVFFNKQFRDIEFGCEMNGGEQ